MTKKTVKEQQHLETSEGDYIQIAEKELCRRVGASYPSKIPIQPTDYTWTQEDENDYREWLINLLSKKGPYRHFSKRYISKLADGFLSNYGWKINGNLPEGK
jgi:hypothetical protein